MLSAPSIIEFTTDAQLLGLNVSAAQETLQRSIYGLTLTDEQRDIWHGCTGREDYPSHPLPGPRSLQERGQERTRGSLRPSWALKPSSAATSSICPGASAVIPLVAQEQRATEIAFGYIRDYLTRSPLLASMVEEVLAQEIQLRNGINIVCFPGTLRSLRGYSTPAGVMDGYYRLEGQVDSDVENQASIRRGMINFPSGPSATMDLLVWRASTVLMNSSIVSARLDRERRLDPSRFAREYEAEFAEDLEAFLPAAWVDAAVAPGRHELPPSENSRYKPRVIPAEEARTPSRWLLSTWRAREQSVASFRT
jgi:hypothetical protein